MSFKRDEEAREQRLADTFGQAVLDRVAEALAVSDAALRTAALPPVESCTRPWEIQP